MGAPETTAGEDVVLPDYVAGFCWDAGTGLG